MRMDVASIRARVLLASLRKSVRKQPPDKMRHYEMESEEQREKEREREYQADKKRLGSLLGSHFFI